MEGEGTAHKHKEGEQSTEISWDMFEIVSTLGNGAFGEVYKVKSLQSTRICESGTERVLLSTKSVKK